MDKDKYVYHADFYEKISFNAQNIKDAYFKYDLNGNILERIFYTNGEMRMKSNFILDGHGNWIKETLESYGNFYISTRIIEYYENN